MKSNKNFFKNGKKLVKKLIYQIQHFQIDQEKKSYQRGKFENNILEIQKFLRENIKSRLILDDLKSIFITTISHRQDKINVLKKFFIFFRVKIINHILNICKLNDNYKIILDILKNEIFYNMNGEEIKKIEIVKCVLSHFRKFGYKESNFPIFVHFLKDKEKIEIVEYVDKWIQEEPEKKMVLKSGYFYSRFLATVTENFLEKFYFSERTRNDISVLIHPIKNFCVPFQSDKVVILKQKNFMSTMIFDMAKEFRLKEICSGLGQRNCILFEEMTIQKLYDQRIWRIVESFIGMSINDFEMIYEKSRR